MQKASLPHGERSRLQEITQSVYNAAMKRKVPYAVGSFAEIITGDYYFIDKTPFLHELEQYKVPIFLRPRRFGKSLWCSLLECYYDINQQEAFETLFGGLAIEQGCKGLASLMKLVSPKFW